ncbi:MAG: hypothetical protein R6X02_18700 [Enhygromyxa sp.]
MPWTIDDSRAETNDIPPACGRTYYAWRRAIRDEHLHPREAAEQAGDSDYETYGGGRYTIRLSQRHRVFFVVDDDNEEVTVVKVGTHDAPRGW